MKFKRKVLEPEEIKEMYPLSKDLEKIKKDNDEQIDYS